MEYGTQKKERIFYVELKSKRDLKEISLGDGAAETVLVEGSLGELVQATFKEGVILEVIGKNGTLRIDLIEDEITKSAEQKITEAVAP